MSKINRKKLPVGLSSFEELREGGYYYVDKTRFVWELIERGVPCNLLTRPRRFGKSLFLDTIRCLFEGQQALFAGTWIEDQWNWDKKHPVVNIDLSEGSNGYVRGLRDSIRRQVMDISERFDIPYQDWEGCADLMASLVSKVRNKWGARVVLLIDEYDSPISKARSEEEKLELEDEIGSILRTIKANGRNLHFVLMTGILNIPQLRMGNSAGNNFIDISLEPQFNDICGYTQTELEDIFAPELWREDLNKEISLESLREWYDGYNFGGENDLYNPYDVLLTFQKNILSDWWTYYGISSVAMRALKKHKYTDFTSFSVDVDRGTLQFGFTSDSMYISILLFQCGYLSIKKDYQTKCNGSSYRLEPSNLEVVRALGQMQVSILIDREIDPAYYNEFKTLFRHHDFTGLHEFMRQKFFSLLTYDERPKEFKERHFSVILKGLFIGAGFSVVRGEVHTQEGRADIVVEDGDTCYICELKLIRTDAEHGCALRQIHDRGYASVAKTASEVWLLGFEFTTTGIACDDDDPPVNLAYLDVDKAT